MNIEGIEPFEFETRDMSFLLREDLVEKLEKEAARRGMAPDDFVAEALFDYLARRADIEEE